MRRQSRVTLKEMTIQGVQQDMALQRTSVQNNQAYSVLQQLRPLMIAGQWTGMWPFQLVGDKEETMVRFSWRTLPAVLCFWVALVFVGHCCFQIRQVQALIVGNSGVNGDVVSLLPWIGGTIVVVCTQGRLLARGPQIAGLFNDWILLQQSVRQHTPDLVYKRVLGQQEPSNDKSHFKLRLYIFYGTLTIGSTVAVSYNYYISPTFCSFWTSLFPDNVQNLLYPGLVFYIYIALAFNIGASVTDIIACVVSRNLQIEFQHLDRWLSATLQSHQFWRKDQRKYSDNRIIGLLYNQRSIECEEDDGTVWAEKVMSTNIRKMTMGVQESCVKVIHLHNRLGQAVSQANDVFGPLVLLQMGFSLLMISSLTYVAVKHLRGSDTGAAINFGLNGLNFWLKILVFVVVCSGLTRSSSSIGTTFAKHLTLLDTHTLLRVGLFLQNLKDNAVGVSAWGFFTVQLGTLLTFWATVVTYLVVLFQS